MAFSIRLTEQEKSIASSYAKIEDEYDIAVYEEAYKEYKESGEKSRPIEELWQELGYEL